MYGEESDSDLGTTQSAPPSEGMAVAYEERQSSPPWFWLLAFSLPVLLVLLAVLFAFPSCREGRDDPPTVQIAPGVDGVTFSLGQSLAIRSQATDDKGVTRIELVINGFSIATAEAPGGGQKVFAAEQPFQPPGVGVYIVEVTAYDTDGQASEPARVRFAIEAGGALPPGSPTATAPPTPTDTPVPGVPGPDGCEHNARYVADVTIPDDTRLDPGTEFVKTWRLGNSGTCAWGAGYQLIFVEGDQMGAPASVSVPETPPGATVDVSVFFRAPTEYGTYISRWRMRTADGREFGNKIFVRIVVAPPPTETPVPTDTPLATDTPEATATEVATVTPVPPPDLTIDELDLRVSRVGKPITLTVMVSNLGPGGTGAPVPVTMLVASGQETVANLAPMGPGVRAPLTFFYTFAEPAMIDIAVYVDRDNQIPEVDETNNMTVTQAIVNPPIYVSDTLTLTLGSQIDFDVDALADASWQLEDQTVYLVLQNGAGAVLLDSQQEQVGYLQLEGITWEHTRLSLAELTEGITLGLLTSDDHLGYAWVEAVLDEQGTSARLAYVLWEWPGERP